MFTSLATFRYFWWNRQKHFQFYDYSLLGRRCVPRQVLIFRLCAFQEQNLEFEIHLLFRHRWKVNQLLFFSSKKFSPQKYLNGLNLGQPPSVCQPHQRYQGRHLGSISIISATQSIDSRNLLSLKLWNESQRSEFCWKLFPSYDTLPRPALQFLIIDPTNQQTCDNQ